MALVIRDRAKVLSTSTGTGDFTLGAAVSGFQEWAAADGDQAYYVIADFNGNFEVGFGDIIVSGGTTLVRTTVLDGSNGPGNLVNFPAGDKHVGINIPAHTYKSIAVGPPNPFVSFTYPKASDVGGFAVGDGAFADAGNAIAIGPRSYSRLFGEIAMGNGNALTGGSGIAHRSFIGLSSLTTDATPSTLLTADLGEIDFLAETACLMDISLVARNTSGTESRFFRVEDLGIRVDASNPPVIVGTPTLTSFGDAGTTSWALDSPTIVEGALRLTVTGEAGKTIHWYASVQAVFVGYVG